MSMAGAGAGTGTVVDDPSILVIVGRVEVAVVTVVGMLATDTGAETGRETRSLLGEEKSKPDISLLLSNTSVLALFCLVWLEVLL